MAITCRRVRSNEMSTVLDLIQTRINSGSRVCLTDRPVNQDWVDQVMAKPDTYESSHRVFGLFVDDVLQTLFIVRIVGDIYVVSMMISRRTGEKVNIKDGYGENSTILLDYALDEMEKEGFLVFYSMIPNHPKWKRAEKNPNRRKKDEYLIEEVLIIPANTTPDQTDKIPFDVRDITSRPFNLDMVVRKMTYRGKTT